MKTAPSLIFAAWKKLIVAFLLSAAAGLITGLLAITCSGIHPELLFEASTRRLSYALPLFQTGSQYGIDLGILLFVWNLIGALITISFLHTAALFNPDRLGTSPQGLRTVLCGKKRMKLLCHLPGCTKIEAEPLRRLYVC